LGSSNRPLVAIVAREVAGHQPRSATIDLDCVLLPSDIWLEWPEDLYSYANIYSYSFW
jgi:hypothetical protein